jgi:wyosine [tRNA(Phe)-imidazoG37] synthetase (radical SAM superfamily)
MSTFLFDKIVFGPVKSRRLGVSLGVNLLPVTRKICNFDCVYCECGLNIEGKAKGSVLPKREEVSHDLEMRLQEMVASGELPDVITFAGNGEPTMHPDFMDIIEDTLLLRDKYCKTARVSVLSNATMLHKPSVVKALQMIDQNILKLDSCVPATVQKLNQPIGTFDLSKVISQLQQFEGKLVIQTMFTRGTVNGNLIDNTTDEELNAWQAAVKQINPAMVMIYTVARDTPYDGLKKLSVAELTVIGKRITDIGLEVQVSG